MNTPSLISFDYAIKYLLKDSKGDYSIVEGFISALLKTQGYKEVKIITVLDGESNKENPLVKRSLADVVVQDKDNRKYIIEIERSTKDSFIHKACFNTSRLIVDNLAQRIDYTGIVKVFHISLLYFPVGEGSIYYGKMDLNEIETKERLSVQFTNPETGVKSDVTDAFPEYFVISVPGFNDRLEKEIHDWLYVMKYEEVPATFNAPYMKQVAEKLSVLRMTPAEWDEYAYYQKKLCDEKEAAKVQREMGVEEGKVIGKAEGIEEGKVIGKAIGIEEGIEKTALTMLALNVDVKTIAQYTSLPLEHIERLKSLKK